jgi:NTE family protein
MEVLRDHMKRWQESITKGRCKKMKSKAVADGKSDSTGNHDCAAKTYLIEVGFDALKDETEREHLKDLPTTFNLESQDVDRLRKAARLILQESDEFQDLIGSLK